jgi:cob(I)alamin adenosyltransferase
MALYTRKGDQGMTSVTGGGDSKRISKGDPFARLIGSIDKLHASFISVQPYAEMTMFREWIRCIMNLNSFVASRFSKMEYAPTTKDVEELEFQIKIWKPKEVVKKFVMYTIPYDEGFDRWNQARVQTRECENILHQVPHEIPATTAAWLNRLSSLCYAMMLYYGDRVQIVYREFNP